MKELTIEEKAKRYDEAIERAKRWYDANTNEGFRAIFKDIFPELKENEDEEIRKEIISYVKSSGAVSNKKWIAWLEKQGEHNLIEIYPIFRVGDYIRNKKTGDKVLIKQLDIATKAYYYVSYDGAAVNHSDFSFSQQNEWEIIGQNITEKKPTDEEMKILLQTEYEKDKADAIEAAMKAVTKDKESAIKFLKSAGIMNDNGKLAKEYVANDVEQKSVWSEEDEEMVECVIEAIDTNYAVSDYNEMVTWLKSLKERYTWKPSEKQVKGIECAIKTLRHQLNVEDKRLNSLYTDLKKLREK